MKKQFLTIVLAVVSLQSPGMASVTQTDVSADKNLAEQDLFEGKFDEANKLYKRLVKDAEKAGDTKQAADIFDGYAWLLQTQRKMEDAAQYATRALAIRQKVLQPDDPLIAESYEHIGEQNEAQGLYKQALEGYTKAYQILANNHDQGIAPQYSNVMERAAMMQMKLGNIDGANKLFAQELSEKARIGAQFQRYANLPAAQTVMYRYTQGAPNTSRDAVAGESLASINANGLIVQAVVLAAEDFKGTTAFVRVINNSDRPVDFLPEPPFLLETSPSFRVATVLQNDRVAAQIEKAGQHKANMIRFWQGDATTTVTQNVMTSGNMWNNGYGYGMYPNGAWGAYPYNRRSGSQMTTITTQVPDWEARARAQARAQAATEKANAAADIVRSQKLLATTLPPGQMTQGSALFDSTKLKTGILRIPVGNAVFEFPVGR